MPSPQGHITWRDLVTDATAVLDDANDARWIVERVADLDRAGLLLALDEVVPTRVIEFCEGLVRRRAAGEPLQLVLGRWQFRRLDLAVDRRALIPRPETEQVVEFALAELARLEVIDPVCVDLGTGTGCIALSLATEGEIGEMWAVDVSVEALALARSNVAGVGGTAASRVRLVLGDWFGALPGDLAGRVTLVVANPPYVGEDERGDLDPSVLDWEPHEALFAGDDGLADIRRILAEVPRWLAHPAALVLELAPRQAEEAVRLAMAAGADHAEIRPDLTGRPRALVARWS